MRPVCAALLLATLALACAAKPLVDPFPASAIDAAERAGQLKELYASVTAAKEAIGPEDERADERIAELTADLTTISEKLGVGLAADISEQLEAARMPSGLISQVELTRLREGLPEVREYSQAAAEKLAASIQAEESNTQAAKDALSEEIKLVPRSEPRRELSLRMKVAILAGQGSPEERELVDAKGKILEQLQASFDDHMRDEAYDAAREDMTILIDLVPDDVEFRERLAELETTVFERAFWMALEDGDPDGAYDRLKEISQTEKFVEIRPRLESSAGRMAQFFVTLAAKETRQRRLSEAFRWFRQAREVREILGLDPRAEVPEEQIFVEAAHERYAEASEDGLDGLAWGYLNVVMDLRPRYARLRRETRQTREVVLHKAIKRLSAGAFEDSKTSTEFGPTVGSKVVQYLFEKVPNDVRIIENIDRTRDTEESDFILKGTILEARVDVTELERQQTQRVVTETEQVANPDHDEWRLLSKGEREGRKEPEKFIARQRMDVVVFKVTHHRKVGLFSASFRLIDARTNRVLYADSVQKQETHTDTSSEGIQIGDFKMELKLADLPSDLEILAELAENVSASIGESLAKLLILPEQRYQEEAERFRDEGSYMDASREFAYSMVLRMRKGEHVDELRDELMRVTLQAEPER